jgi:protein-L-isoaspartate(D-aspartate) O-methyltransferase
MAIVAAAICLLVPPHSGSSRGAEPPAAREEHKPSAKWDRPRVEARSGERRAMVRRDIESRGVASEAVLEAMRNAPRHEFVPDGLQSRAHDDCPLAIGHGQTISQPYIVAYMTEVLALKPADRVLEIGTGSGYQAAVLSELTPHVYTIEIIKALGEQAQERFKRLGYKTIQCKVGDGYYGWPGEKDGFDAIIVTCAAGSVPPPLLKQLKPGGRMCIPVQTGGLFQELVLVTKDSEGKVTSKSLMGVAFVPLTREVR